MQFTFPPNNPVVVPVAGSDVFFPVHRIYCVGLNYSEHAKEMGGSGREAPFFFMKPADAIMAVPHGSVGEMPYPPMTNNLHHEVELVVAIGVGGKNITIADAQKHVWGYAIGLDMTRRDLQAESKKAGRPWSTGKGFDFAAPIAPIHPLSETGWMDHGAIHLSVNDIPRQQSNVSNLIWNVAEVIATLSTYFTLQPGDLIFTGTPEGVGAVKHGDLLKAGIDQLGDLQVKIV